MTYKYHVRPSSQCLPFSRTKLFREVFEFRTCGEIHQVWLGTGHVFVTTCSGKQLYTFDSKSTEHIQDVETSSCLDISDDVPVLSVLLKSPQTVLIVFINGVIQIWNYRPDHFWSKQTVLRLSNSHLATVTDISYSISQNALYWCQQDVSECGTTTTYSIYKRQIIEGEEGSKALPKFGPASLIINNCPRCAVFPLGHGVVIVSENESKQAQFVVKLCTLTGHVTLLVDSEWLSVRDVNVHKPVNFSQIVIKSLQHLNKLMGKTVLQTTYSAKTQTLHLLYNTGSICTLFHAQDSRPKEVNVENLRTEGLLGMFVQSQLIGLTYQNEIRLYSVHTGVLSCTIDIPDDSKVHGVVQNLFGNIQQAVYTDDNLLTLQKYSESKDMSEISLLEFSHFQSDAVRLSYIDKMQKYATNKVDTLTLENIQKRWIDSLGIPPTSKLQEIVEPYLSQYWKLELLMQDGFNNPNAISQLRPQTIMEEVTCLLDPKSSMTRSARQSQLMLLSQFHPLEVLNTLLSYLPLTEGELSTSQQQKWRCALTQETSDVTGSCDIAIPLFELMCHLLYKHKPDKLFQFVQYGQRVWDQKVGMSAFVRRRQVPFILERAVKCLPQPEYSCNPDIAIIAHVNILLTSEVSGCYTKAIHLLLSAEKWTEALDLLNEYRNKCQQYPLLYQMTMAALNKKNVLPKYSDRIFSLMPSLGSTNDVLENSPSMGQGIFCATEDDISMETVRPHLLQCLSIYDQEDN